MKTRITRTIMANHDVNGNSCNFKATLLKVFVRGVFLVIWSLKKDEV